MKGDGDILVVLAVQFAIIYFYNTVHKDTPPWDDGSALGWVLHQDRILKPFARRACQ